MSVLESMRSGSDSTFMQVVMALVVISFVGWSAMPNGDRSNVVAIVNGEKIMDTEFGRAYRDAQVVRESQIGRSLSNEEQKQLSDEVRGRLIEGEVVLQEARALGIEVSDTEVARQLLQIPGIRTEQGRFDQELYSRYLKRRGFTKADHEERLREDLMRQKLMTLVFTGASISEPALKDAFVESETRIDLTYVRIRPSAFAAQVQITPEDRSLWLVENGAAVEETYQRDFDRLYNHPEQVRLRVIRLATTKEQVADMLPRINTIRAAAEAGDDFGELARRWSEDLSAVDGGDLGARPVRQLGSDVQSAIEGLDVGKVSRVVTTENDLRIYKLDERIPASQETLDQVRDKIADQLIASERGPTLAAGFAEEQLLATWKASNEVPRELVEAQGMSVMTTGPIPAVAQNSPFSPPAAMLNDARTVAPGTVLPEVYEQAGTLWVGQLTERIDADLALFDAQRDQIRESVLLQRRISFFQGWVADAKARAEIQ